MSEDHPRRGQDFVGFLFLALLVWAPLPFASNRPLTSVLLSGLMLLLLLVWCSIHLATPERLRIAGPLWIAMALILPVLCWGWLQWQPWMVDLLPSFTAHPVWAAADRYGLDSTPNLTIDPSAAREALVRFAGYLAAFCLAYGLCQHSARAWRICHVLVAVGVVYAGYGLIEKFGGFNHVLWEPKIAYWGFVTSTFINRNSYATYANLGLIIAICLTIEPLLAARGTTDAKRIAVELLSKLLGKRPYLLLACLILVTASLLTGSRGGLLSLIGALACMGFLIFLLLRPALRTALAVAALLLLMGGALVGLSGNAALERMDTASIERETDTEGNSRFAIYELAIQMIKDRPLVGHGFGGFEPTFFMYRDDRFPLVYDKAHDTYLEHAVELGIPAALMLYGGALALFLLCLRGVFHRRRNRLFPLIGVTATVCVALHALIDFSLQIPAVAVTFAAILGMASAQSLRSPRPVLEDNPPVVIDDSGIGPVHA